MSTTKNLCGIDFGTSNSTIGIIKNNSPELINLENNSPIVPSAIFYEDGDGKTVYGQKALDYYREHASGRLLRSFKSILGTSLMEEKTLIRKTRVPFSFVIKQFISHMKTQAEQIEQTNLDYAIIGRPINFVDNDPVRNKLAQDTLELIAKQAGFKDVAFQYEPIAASLKYEQSLSSEELVLIVDIGGGTTDISIVSLSPKFVNIQDRSQHCLANHGVHIGGTDFDKHLSLQSFMPLLGFNEYMPKYIYHDMATWHRINNIYTPEFINSVRQFKGRLAPTYYNRIINTLKERLASSIAFNVEEAKIELSTKHNVIKDLSFLEDNLQAHVSAKDLKIAMKEDLHRIGVTIDECLAQANIKRSDINSIFLTGGSSKMVLIKNYVQSLFPTTKIDNSDSLSSVGTGLVLDAMKKFR